ncbi:hypothetical protein N7509_003086 [Penicillium cosmopolitanum]|uniref:Uncharacterized protein n=1 Tax=Penicillium cosmopolitanum TaxID=1131564 RepID=A0A9W9W4C1_9EURO|nr:uncharacterized protein N7509_003086 [Penicillium cosmopolitanum]KAJ5403215.1 hypothetical protein N7509_003086 [Penicillium cosmopolitanum]
MAAHNADYARSASNQNDHPDEKHYSKESFVKDIEEWIDKLNEENGFHIVNTWSAVLYYGVVANDCFVPY